MTDTAIKPAPINHWLNGKLTPGTSGRSARVFNPATGEVQGLVDLASAEEIGSPTAHREAETAKAHRG